MRNVGCDVTDTVLQSYFQVFVHPRYEVRFGLRRIDVLFESSIIAVI